MVRFHLIRTRQLFARKLAAHRLTRDHRRHAVATLHYMGGERG